MQLAKKAIACLLVLSFLMPVSGRQVKAAEEVKPNQEAPNQIMPPKEGKIELADKRTENTKTYLKSDGSKELVVYQEPIHYKTSDNSSQWQEINTNLEQANDLLGIARQDQIQNRSNDFNLNVSRNLAEDAFSVEKNGSKISFGLNDIRSSIPDKDLGFDKNLLGKIVPEVKGNKVSFRGILANTEINLYSMPRGVKEDIVLNKYDGQNVFYFDLKLQNMTYEKQSDGSYKFFETTGHKEVFLMPRFYMWDSKGGKDSLENEYSYDVISEIIKTDSGYRVVITADNDWLLSSDRVFPVTIDPSVIETHVGTEDSYVQSSYPDSRYKSWDQRALYVGRHNTKGATRTLIDFSLPDLRYARIFGAAVYAFQYNCNGDSCNSQSINVLTTGDYDPWDVYWNNQPGWIDVVGNGSSNTTWDWFGADVSAAVKRWYEGDSTGSRRGSFEFSQVDENVSGHRTWVSSNHPDYASWGQPKLVIVYSDYNAYYQPDDIPQPVYNNMEIAVPIVLQNTGRNWWNRGQVNLAYHWYRSNGELVTWDGERTELPWDVEPHSGTFKITAGVKTPADAGDYFLVWDLVHESVNWFSDVGVQPCYQGVLISYIQDYNARYYADSVQALFVKDSVTLNVNVKNIGRQTWTRDRFYLGYHWIKPDGHKYYPDGDWTPLPRDVSGFGDWITVSATIKAPDVAGQFTLEWDMVLSGSWYFSDIGIPTDNYSVNIIFRRDYDANFLLPDLNNIIAGTNTKIPVTVQNTGRNSWDAQLVNLGYHWYNRKTQEYAIFTTNAGSIPKSLKYGEYATVFYSIRAPLNAGDYTLVFDIFIADQGWISELGAPMPERTILVSAPSFSSITHMGTEDYYSKAGPVDLATGNLSYSSADMGLPSNSGGLSIVRSYNSSLLDNKYNPDSNGYITQWLINGPYKENDPSVRLSKPYFENEALVRPSVGSTSSNNLWFQDDTYNGILDFHNALWDNANFELAKSINSTTYAHTYVYSPVERNVQLKIGAKDGLKVWLNGENIYTKDVYRTFTDGSDVVTGKLNVGWNRLLAKVSLSTGSWLLAVRILNSDGTAINDIRTCLNNPTVFQPSKIAGYGWTYNFEERIFDADPENIYYRDGTGTVNIFAKNASGNYQKPAGTDWNLIKNSNNTYSLTAKSGKKINFGTDGKIQSAVDLSGNTLTFRYDMKGNCVKIVDGSRYITLTYDSTNGYLTKVADNQGNSIRYIYNDGVLPTALVGSQLLLTKVIDPLNKSFEYRYDSASRMAQFIDKNGNSMTIAYDTNKKVSKVTDANNYSTDFNYSKQLTTVKDAKGRVSEAEFNGVNLLTSFKDTKGYKELYSYDHSYNLSTIIPDVPENDFYYYKWNYAYDCNDNLGSITDPENHVTNYSYNETNDLIKIIDPKSNTTTYTYSTDGRRLLLSETNPLGNKTLYTYNSGGHRTSITDPNGAVVTYTYSKDGDLISSTTPKKEKTTYVYDSIGQKTSEISPLGNTINYAYDKMGRLLSAKDSLNLTMAYAYDGNGNKITETNPKGVSKYYTYNKLNWLVAVKDEIGAVMTYRYDEVGNKVATIDPKGKTIAYEYDDLNQLVRQTDAAGKTSTISYDRNGNLVTAVDSNGSTFSQTPNKSGEVVKSVDPEGSTTFDYDRSGNLIKANTTVHSEQVQIAYDENNNSTSVSSNITGTVTNTYDKNNNPTNIVVPTATINFHYDANNQVDQVSTKINQTGQQLVSTLAKDAEGKLLKINKTNGDVASYNYDKAGRITYFENRNKSQYLQQSFTYKYDANSNVIAVTDKYGQSQSFSYDPRNQLIKENLATYTYDLTGNRKSYINGFNTTTYTYDEAGDANRLLKVTEKTKTIQFGYDNNGSAIKKTDSKLGTTQYLYDSDNYFTKAVLPDNTVVEYVYDKLAKRRIKRTETSPTGSKKITKFIYDGDRLVSETDDKDIVQRSYAWDEDENLLSVTINIGSGKYATYYYLKNAKGDIVGLSDASGNRVVDYTYDAWGNITRSATIGTTAPKDLDKMNPRLYSSYWYDSTLNLYFMRTRMYDASLGRFLSRDALSNDSEALESNPYIYCGNNPVDRIDPSGKGWFSKIKQYAVAAYNKVNNAFKAISNTIANYLMSDNIVGRAIDWAGPKLAKIPGMARTSETFGKVADWTQGSASKTLAAGFTTGIVAAATAYSGAAGISAAIRSGSAAINWAGTSIAATSWAGGASNLLYHAEDRGHGAGMTNWQYASRVINVVNEAEDIGMEMTKKGEFRYIYRQDNWIAVTNLDGKIITGFARKSAESAMRYFERNNFLK